MPRIYTRFPTRGPGIGLLLLRIAIGVTLLAHANFIAGTQDFRIIAVAMGVLAFLSGLALLAGFLTPVVSILALTIVVGTGFSWFPASQSGVIAGNHLFLDVVVMAAAIGLLGPGAFSVDAVMFGWRKIIIPPVPPTEKA